LKQRTFLYDFIANQVIGHAKMRQSKMGIKKIEILLFFSAKTQKNLRLLCLKKSCNTHAKPAGCPWLISL